MNRLTVLAVIVTIGFAIFLEIACRRGDISFNTGKVEGPSEEIVIKHLIK